MASLQRSVVNTPFEPVAAARTTMIVAKTKRFNQGMSVMVTGVTEAGGEMFQLTIWKVEPPYTPSDIQMGMKLFINNPKDITDKLDSRSWGQWDLRKVAEWKRRGHSLLGGGVWQCQSVDVDPSGRLHFETCFSPIALNRPGLFSGKVENIDSEVMNFASGASIEKKKITIAGTKNTVGRVFFTIGGTYADNIVVGDTVAFFAADYGFLPYLDSIPYVPVIEKTARPAIARFKVRRQAVARLKGLVRAIVVFRRMRLRAAEAVYAPGKKGYDVAAASFRAAAAALGVLDV